MYKLDLPVDYKEAAAIERRRLMEEQRKSRIFNAKVRTIGVSNLIFFQTSKVKWLIAGLQCNYNAPTLFHNKKESLTYNDHGILQTQHTLAYPCSCLHEMRGKGGGDFSFSQFLNHHRHSSHWVRPFLKRPLTQYKSIRHIFLLQHFMHQLSIVYHISNYRTCM